MPPINVVSNFHDYWLLLKVQCSRVGKFSPMVLSVKSSSCKYLRDYKATPWALHSTCIYCNINRFSSIVFTSQGDKLQNQVTAPAKVNINWEITESFTQERGVYQRQRYLVTPQWSHGHQLLSGGQNLQLFSRFLLTSRQGKLPPVSPTCSPPSLMSMRKRCHHKKFTLFGTFTRHISKSGPNLQWESGANK